MSKDVSDLEARAMKWRSIRSIFSSSPSHGHIQVVPCLD
jgi:hypothetical protein